MYYLIKTNNTNNTYNIVEGKCNTSRRWTMKDRCGYYYEYYGINQDEGKSFNTKDIIYKAKTKSFLNKKFAELLV